MPLYGFECEDCQSDFEELVMSSSQIDQVTCPDCSGNKVHKKLSMVAAMSSKGSSSTSIASTACAPSG